MTTNAITVSGLRKRYGDLEAVRGLDLEVRTGAGSMRLFRWSPKR